jgi:hypothetical protein
MSRPTVEQRFWSRIEYTDTCWNWLGGKSVYGYGALSVGGSAGNNIGTHRIAWTLTQGPIPAGMWVLHKCDNRMCVNPEHLFLGDTYINSEDRRVKGRSTRGEAHHRAKLTEDQALEIRRRMRAGGETHKKLAAEFGVSISLIGGIKAGIQWGWLCESS